MDTVSLQTYTDYSAYLNKDIISNLNKSANIVDNQETIKDEAKIIESKNENTNEQKESSQKDNIAFYFNYQAVQATKSKMELLVEDEENDINDTISYKEISEITRLKNRDIFLQSFQGEISNTQPSSRGVEIWT